MNASLNNIQIIASRLFILVLLILSCSAFSGKKQAKKHYEKGNKKLECKDFKGAIQEYSKAIKQDKNLAQAYYNRGIAKSWLNDLEGAIDDLERAAILNKTYYSERRGKSNTSKSVYWNSDNKEGLIRLPVFSK